MMSRLTDSDKKKHTKICNLSEILTHDTSGNSAQNGMPQTL